MRRAGTFKIGLLTGLLSTLLVLIPAGYVLAISGVCSNCHTMHNSQGGTKMADRDAPYDYLLMADCIACHTGPLGDTDDVNSFGAPIVLHISPPSGQGNGKTLAGGDFYWVATGLGATDSNGHNVASLAAVDVAINAKIGNNPPGWDPAATNGFTFGQVAGGLASWGSQLTCAGVYGCHGQHNATGIIGAHHGNTGGTSNQCSTATTVGNSFRFLAGIKGLENSEWNWSEAAGIHNEYYGVDDTTGRNATTYSSQDTTSFSCAECHGIFHATIASGAAAASPWLRHPTDIALPNKTEYASYTGYSVEAPVARPTIPASSSATVLPGGTGDTGAIVMCLSCHRAHGSPEPDLLRWSYSTMIAGGASADTGCFTCHTTKNVAP